MEGGKAEKYQILSRSTSKIWWQLWPLIALNGLELGYLKVCLDPDDLNLETECLQLMASTAEKPLLKIVWVFFSPLDQTPQKWKIILFVLTPWALPSGDQILWNFGALILPTPWQS